MEFDKFIDSKLTEKGFMPNGDKIFIITEKSVDKIKELFKDK
jgi:hypothetical protein